MHQEQLLPIAGNSGTRNRRIYFAGKRAMDLVLAAIGLVLATPAMLLIALLIKLDSAGPVLFKQTRLGRGGRPFTFYKFRTMYQNAGHELHRQYVQSLIRNEIPQNGSSDPPTASVFKLTRDPRITRVGRFLRRTSLDELPQIFNVIKGEMSLVGPRPPLPYEVEEYQDWHRGRLTAIPGITGLWQVRGRSRVPFDEMVRMDLDYIARQSLWLDFRILLLTIPAVISGNGAE
ncbi:MAG: sugar transferase [Chloroflexi bacterium]|nr:MAG: sugar transferase [Chloroflexota bacterium]